MKFETYLAYRYFKGSRKGAKFLSFIKSMAIVGVAIGSAGLLIALSIVHGFKSTINNKILGFAPHITVLSFTDQPIYRADTLNTYLNQFEEIESSQIVSEGQVMVQTKKGITGTLLKGISDPDIYAFRDYIAEGTFNLEKDSNGFPGIILGANLVKTLGADIGSIITIYTIQGVPSLVNSPEIQQFRLAGIYETSIDIFDELYAITDIAFTKKLFNLDEHHAHAIELKLADHSKIETTNKQLDSELSFPYYQETINARYGNIFAWVELQENMIPFVISVMIIVAAFNLIGAVLMMVLERTKDIGILKTIGGKSSLIRKVFLLEGVMVAGIGLAIGIGISLLFAYLQLEYQIIPLTEENYYMSYAPVELRFFDFVITSIVTITLCALASWLPARIAAKIDPIKVIAFGR